PDTTGDVRASGPPRRDGRSRPSARHRLLPTPARDPALHLGRALDDRRVLRRDRRVVPHADARPDARRALRVPLELRPLPDAADGVPPARRLAVPDVRRGPGVPGRRRARRAAEAAAALEGRLPDLPRAPGADPREGARPVLAVPGLADAQ